MTWQPSLAALDDQSRGFCPMPCYRTPRPHRRIVQHPGSLTRLLRALCHDSFRVEVLDERRGRPTLDEALALELRPETRVWIREVHLRGDGRPWVRARTVIPFTSLRGRNRALQQLGSRPLGSALFGPRPWRRSAFTCGRSTSEGELARRSLFRRGRHSLLVTETFLPELWEDVLPLARAYNTIRMDAVRPL